MNLSCLGVLATLFWHLNWFNEKFGPDGRDWQNCTRKEIVNFGVTEYIHNRPSTVAVVDLFTGSVRTIKTEWTLPSDCSINLFELWQQTFSIKAPESQFHHFRLLATCSRGTFLTSRPGTRSPRWTQTRSPSTTWGTLMRRETSVYNPFNFDV